MNKMYPVAWVLASGERYPRATDEGDQDPGTEEKPTGGRSAWKGDATGSDNLTSPIRAWIVNLIRSIARNGRILRRT